MSPYYYFIVSFFHDMPYMFFVLCSDAFVKERLWIPPFISSQIDRLGNIYNMNVCLVHRQWLIPSYLVLPDDFVERQINKDISAGKPDGAFWNIISVVAFSKNHYFVSGLSNDISNMWSVQCHNTFVKISTCWHSRKSRLLFCLYIAALYM